MKRIIAQFHSVSWRKAVLPSVRSMKVLRKVLQQNEQIRALQNTPPTKDLYGLRE